MVVSGILDLATLLLFSNIKVFSLTPPWVFSAQEIWYQICRLYIIHPDSIGYEEGLPSFKEWKYALTFSHLNWRKIFEDIKKEEKVQEGCHTGCIGF